MSAFMQQETIQKLIRLFRPAGEVQVTPLPPSGSDRLYVRLSDGKKSALGAYCPDKRENEVFVKFTRHFQSKQAGNVPALLGVSARDHIFLVEDLGNTTLLDELMHERNATGKQLLSSGMMNTYREALRVLSEMQIEGAKGFDWKVYLTSPVFSRQYMQWDLEYFKYYLLNPSGIPYDKIQLEQDFRTMTEWLAKVPCRFFMHRDFQARNIMLDGSPRIIDYQGGCKGPLLYDVASLLFQAKAAIPPGQIRILFRYYLKLVDDKIPAKEKKQMESWFRGFALLRVLQTLGAYGYRGLFEQKPHFLESLPAGLSNLNMVLKEFRPAIKTPYLFRILRSLAVSDPFTAPSFSPSSPLSIEVLSFSYKKGLPQDASGNGGGFIFDCRGLHNPGRYEPYKTLTGKDAPVKQFLLSESRVSDFVNDVMRTVLPTIENYAERGFSNLQIAFGCTGGQHRSVFCAESVAGKLRKMGLKVNLTHREFPGI